VATSKGMDERPHIILFTTDQQRGDHLSIAGHPLVETPNVDAFVQRGAYFPNAYTEIPSTTGARRCLLGGQGSYTCGLIGYSATEWHEPNTLAQVLADAGYHCINVGWRNLHPRRKLYGFHNVIVHDLGEGVDDYWDWLRGQVGPEAYERMHGCEANGWAARPWPYEERLHPTNWTIDVAVDQLRKRDPTRPFFIWVSHLRPHSPYDPPRFHWDRYIGRDLPEVPIGNWAGKHDIPQPGLPRDAWHGRLTPDQLHRMRAAYMGSCTHIDDQLGRFIETLKRPLQLGDNILFLFTSDHGDMMGDHHLLRKTYAYEGSARIPFLIGYPQGCDLPTGTFDQVVGLQDVMPTLLEAAGAGVPDSVTGESVFKAIRGEPWREFIHGEHSPCYAVEEAMQYLTDGREKYIYFPATGEEQLFDLVNDRGEVHDLSAGDAHADRLALWRSRLIEILGRRGDGFSDGRRLLVRKDRWSPVVGE